MGCHISLTQVKRLVYTSGVDMLYSWGFMVMSLLNNSFVVFTDINATVCKANVSLRNLQSKCATNLRTSDLIAAICEKPIIYIIK